MIIESTSIEGLKIINCKILEDKRGSFLKTFNDEIFKSHAINVNIKETYYSVSHKDVIRGMHFQIPPHDHLKIVYVPAGRILDVVLDLRNGSPTYGETYSVELSAKNGKAILIPSGLAHGFKSLEDNAITTYMQTSCYAPNHDCGIRYDSFNFDWNCETPIISERDKSFDNFEDYHTPFEFNG
ncbi:dTDP-4-dehydrorhamnose 3,5-epimerase family protein [Opitutales bacterium]|nr:dTDP-4-dehydrorhamnose 3,5-epimerase family protein [Opitutales bacterium]